MPTIEDVWIENYKNKGALWIHDGNPARPHALLTSGMHSGGFFNSRPVIADDTLLSAAAGDLVDMFFSVSSGIYVVDRVVGPQTGATKLAQLISTKVNRYRQRTCFFASPAKEGEGSEKRMVFDNPSQMALPGENVLLCEDVITTGSSTELAARAVVEAEGVVMPYILTLVNRSGFTEMDGRKVISLIARPMPVWAPEDCPLCNQGSEAIRPKGIENWERLNRHY